MEIIIINTGEMYQLQLERVLQQIVLILLSLRIQQQSMLCFVMMMLGNLSSKMEIIQGTNR